MRFLAASVVLILLVVATPPAAAHGAFHGDDIPRQYAIVTTVQQANNTVVNIINQDQTFEVVDFEPGDLFILSGRSDGPGTVQATLRRTADEGQVAVLASWSFPPDETLVKGLLMPGPGEYSLDIATLHADPTTFIVQHDHTSTLTDGCTCGLRTLSHVPLNGAAVFTVEPDEAGPYRALVYEPRAHSVAVQVVHAARADARFPEGFAVLDEAASADPGAATGAVHSLTWDARPGERYFVVATSQLNASDPRTWHDEAAGPSRGPLHLYMEAGPAPASGTPAPILASLVVLGAAAWVRRMR